MIPNGTNAKKYALTPRSAMTPRPVSYTHLDVYKRQDKTSELAEKAGAVVRKEYKQGKGNVIRRMFREIDAEVYITVSYTHLDVYKRQHKSNV